MSKLRDMRKMSPRLILEEFEASVAEVVARQVMRNRLGVEPLVPKGDEVKWSENLNRAKKELLRRLER